MDPESTSLRVYNTLTRQLDKFEPVHPGRVNMFVCGPTVYDVSHIGHAKTYVAYDIIARYLRKKGYSVFFILNITDVDDRIIARAKETGEDPLKLSKRYAEAFDNDMKAIGIDSVNLFPKASDHIPEIIGQIRGLIDKGIAYVIEGDVYYDISKFPDYGKLSRQRPEELKVHRVDLDPRKKNPGDFALWKSQKPGEIAWESPWGKGRPGWHIEDTAITLTYFGPTYDLHGGGTELIFPHHEAEIAQAEGLTGRRPLARYWLHTGLLSIKGQEMHKSLGNFIPIQEMIRKMGARALRVFYASTHYRSPLEFTQDALAQAANLARRFQRAYEQLEATTAENPSTGRLNAKFSRPLQEARNEFFEAMDDDFNTPGALTAFIKIIVMAESQEKTPDSNLASSILNSLKELGSLLGFLETESSAQGRFPELVNLLVELRADLRARHEYVLADQIRDRMAKLGIIVEDSAKETRWM